MMLPKESTSSSTQDTSSQDEKKVTTFQEFEDDDKSDSGTGGNMNNDDEDDYDAMLTGSSSTKTLQKGKNGSRSTRSSIKKNPKAVMTQDQQSCMQEKNCGACQLF